MCRGPCGPWGVSEWATGHLTVSILGLAKAVWHRLRVTWEGIWGFSAFPELVHVWTLLLFLSQWRALFYYAHVFIKPKNFCRCPPLIYQYYWTETTFVKNRIEKVRLTRLPNVHIFQTAPVWYKKIVSPKLGKSTFQTYSSESMRCLTWSLYSRRPKGVYFTFLQVYWRRQKKEYIVIICNQMVIYGIKMLLYELIEFLAFLDFQLIPFNFYLMGSMEKKTLICCPDQ